VKKLKGEGLSAVSQSSSILNFATMVSLDFDFKLVSFRPVKKYVKMIISLGFRE